MSSSTSSPADADRVVQDAHRYVRALRRFYSLLLTSALVVAIAVAVNLATSPGRWWFLWVVFGMAIAVAVSAIQTFGARRWLGSAWEQRKLSEILERDRRA